MEFEAAMLPPALENDGVEFIEFSCPKMTPSQVETLNFELGRSLRPRELCGDRACARSLPSGP